MEFKQAPASKKKSAWKLIVVAALVVAISFGIIYATRDRTSNSWPIPVILYHHFDAVSENYLIVTPEMFREQMTALKEAGFQTVTVQQINDYVEFGTPLPEKAFMVTMDDGYLSNLELAAPILEELGMCATIFVIGAYEGATADPHTGKPVIQYLFSYEEALPWIEKGVIDVQCHTFDMHNTIDEPFSQRDGMMPYPGESDADYRAAIELDCQLFREDRPATVSTKLQSLAYPLGYFTEELDAMLADLGYTTTFSIDEYCSILEVHNSDSLRKLGRFNVVDDMSGEYLANFLTEAYQEAQAKIAGIR